MYDLGPYPAIISGDDWVLGERWEFAPQDLLATLKVLDEIEGYRNRADDLYQRQIVSCWGGSGVSAEIIGVGKPTVVAAYAYFFSEAEHLKRVAHRIIPHGNVCQWGR